MEKEKMSIYQYEDKLKEEFIKKEKSKKNKGKIRRLTQLKKRNRAMIRRYEKGA